MRKDALKMYIFALLSSGEFVGMSSPLAVAKKAARIFAMDLPTVLGEIAQMMAEQNGNSIGAAVLGKVNNIIGDISSRGIKAVWDDMQEQYKRGMEVTAKGYK